MRLFTYAVVAAAGALVGCGLLPAQANQRLVTPLVGEWLLQFQVREWGRFSFGVNADFVFKKVEPCGITGESYLSTAPAQFGAIPERWVLDLKCGAEPQTFLFSMKNGRSVIRDLPLVFTKADGFTGKGVLTQYEKANYPVEVVIKAAGAEYQWRITVPWEKEKDKIGMEYRFTMGKPKAK